LLAGTFLYAQPPAGTSTICDRFAQSDAIFSGTAENAWMNLLDTGKMPVHRRKEKSKAVRFLVREWFKGAREESVQVWMTPGDCALRIEAGETYLVYVKINKDKSRFETNACQGTKDIGAAASDLSYLTAAQLGPDHATRVSGIAGTAAGVNVQAKSGIDTRYAITDGTGRFTYDGLAAADWSFSVNGGPAKALHVAPCSCADLPLQ
jgi:hypothetical protein